MVGLGAVGYVAVDGQNNVYVADIHNSRILKLSPTGQIVQRWGEAGDKPGQFDAVNGLAVDCQGNVYATDELSGRVQKFSPMGHVLAVWGSKGTQPGQLLHPQGLDIDRCGNVLVADTHNSRIQSYSPDGRLIRVWGSDTTRGGREGGSSQFSRPADVAVDLRNDVYIADTGNARIQKFAASGRLLSIWGEGFSCPEGIATDQQGNIYVADSGAPNRVVKLSSTGNWLEVWEIPDRRHGDGAGHYVQGVAVDGRGQVYVTEQSEGGASGVVKLSPAGQVLAVWR
jgi:DNA-binding beta-propeller fold protein YncE